MADMYLNYPFDEDIFFQALNEEPDPTKAALLESGAMVADGLIAARIQSDGNHYTIPFYNILTGDEANYDGQTDIPCGETSGDTQSGIVYGRSRGFSARDFAAELSGADPMGHIAGAVARYWNKKRQNRMIGLLNGLFSIENDPAFAKHVVDLASETAPYTIEATTLNTVAAQVLGDNKSAFSTAVMHSTVATALENLQVLTYWKHTDPSGLQRPVALASANGYTVIIDDGVPVDVTGNHPKYTTYLLGDGVLRFASGRVDKPVEPYRDPKTNGGMDTLYTRIRETIHPNGFSFITPDTGWTQSPTDGQLFNPANWVRKFDAKAIPMAKLVTNG